MRSAPSQQAHKVPEYLLKEPGYGYSAAHQGTQDWPWLEVWSQKEEWKGNTKRPSCGMDWKYDLLGDNSVTESRPSSSSAARAAETGAVGSFLTGAFLTAGGGALV